MKGELVTTATKEWVSGVYLTMSDTELAEELTAIKGALDIYLSDEVSNKLVDSFVREYLDDMYEIAKNVLVFRFLESVSEM